MKSFIVMLTLCIIQLFVLEISSAKHPRLIGAEITKNKLTEGKQDQTLYGHPNNYQQSYGKPYGQSYGHQTLYGHPNNYQQSYGKPYGQSYGHQTLYGHPNNYQQSYGQSYGQPYGQSYGQSYEQNYKGGHSHSHYYDDDHHSHIFPAYAMQLFQMKSAIQSALHKVEDDNESLEKIEKIIELLMELTIDLFIFYREGMAGILTRCIIYDQDEPLNHPVKIGNKCYTILDHKDKYDTARQKCLVHGGDLAGPFMEDDDFGDRLADSLRDSDSYSARSNKKITNSKSKLIFFKSVIPKNNSLARSNDQGYNDNRGTNSCYWIGGRGKENGKIVTLYGYKIPNNHRRYISMNTFPYKPAKLEDTSGLAIVGPLTAIEKNWFIKPKSTDKLCGSICEFDTVYTEGDDADHPFGDDDDYSNKLRSVKSKLLQKLIRKVNINKEKHVARKENTAINANSKVVQSQSSIIPEEPEKAEVIAEEQKATTVAE